MQNKFMQGRHCITAAEKAKAKPTKITNFATINTQQHIKQRSYAFN